MGAGVNTGRTNDNGDPIAHWQVPFEITAEACGGGSFSEWMHCNGYIGFSAFK